MNFLYYDAYNSRWMIGPTEGGDLARAQVNSGEICADDLENVDWLEFRVDTKSWNKSSTAKVKCLDNIHCACRTLWISGLKVHTYANGPYYMSDNETFDGRNCFLNFFAISISKITQYLFNYGNNLSYFDFEHIAIFETKSQG